MKLHIILFSSLILILASSCGASQPTVSASRKPASTSYATYNHWDHVEKAASSTKNKKQEKADEAAAIESQSWYTSYAEQEAAADELANKSRTKEAKRVIESLKASCKEYNEFNEKWRKRDSGSYIKQARKHSPHK